MSHSRSLLLLLLTTALLSACASSSNYQAKPGTPTSVAVGVKQFSTPGYDRLTAGEKGVRDYEQLALPALLVEELKRTDGISGAHFLAADSPGVDLIVDGEIKESNGRDLELAITVSRIDGKSLARKTFALEHQPPTHIIPVAAGTLNVTGFFPGTNAHDNRDGTVYTVPHDDSTDVSVIRAADRQLLGQIAAVVSAAKSKYRYAPDDLRALVYSGSKSPSTPELVRMATEAAEVEKQHLFQPFTTALVPRVNATIDVYYQWQRESIPYLNAKESAESAKKSAKVSEIINGTLAITGAIVAGAAAYEGNYQAQSLATNSSMSSARLADQAQAAGEVASNRIKELESALAEQRQQFSTGAAREITVRIYNKVVTLKGSNAEMTAEFRKAVQEEMQKEIAAGGSPELLAGL